MPVNKMACLLHNLMATFFLVSNSSILLPLGFSLCCCRGTSWCDESLALMYESWYKTRKTRTWVLSPDKKDVSPRILFDRSSEDVYSDPGSPMLRRTDMGTYVIAKIKKQDGSTYVLLNGMGATPEGNVPFLDLFDMYVSVDSYSVFLLYNHTDICHMSLTIASSFAEIQEVKSGYGRVTRKNIMKLLLH